MAENEKGEAGGGEGRMPSAVVFFLTNAERARVLAALRKIDTDRVRALLRALGVERPKA